VAPQETRRLLGTGARARRPFIRCQSSAPAWSIALAHLKKPPYVLAACAGAIVASTYVSNPQARVFLENVEPRGLTSSPSATVRFADALQSSLPLLGVVKVDTAVMSLAPTGLSPEAWLGSQDWKDGEPAPEVDTIIYFEHGAERSKVDDQVGAMGPVLNYSVPGTNIRMTTTRPIDPRSAIAPLVRLEQ
jgi:hypothetical protein